MNRLVKFVLLPLLFSFAVGWASAQTTTATGTVIDPDTTAWANGSITFQLIGTGGGNFYCNGAPITPSFVNLTLDGNGAFSTPLCSNNSVTPVNSQWSIRVCSATVAQCQNLNPVTLSGTSQDLTTTINSQLTAIRLPPVWGTPAYKDLEILNPPVGYNYYNITLAVMRMWSGAAWINTGASYSGIPFSNVSDGSPATWNAGGGFQGNGVITLNHTVATRALNVTGLVSGGSYTLEVLQDATGGAALTSGTGCTWVYNSGVPLAIFSIPSAASTISLINFLYDGSRCVVLPPDYYPNGESGVAVGFQALPKVTTGINNQAIGWRAGYNITTGNYNDFFGHDAGFAPSGASSNNTFIGEGAGFGNNVPAVMNNNTCVGTNCLLNVQNSYNSGLGYGALQNAGNTQQNTAIGFNACLTVTTGASNTCLGAGADVTTATFAFSTAIGTNAKTTASHQIMLGTTAENTALASGNEQDMLLHSAAGTALPTCNAGAKGLRSQVSDATTPTYLGAYVSGGAIDTPVVCNGTAWVTY